VAQLGLTTAGRARILQVRVVPVAGGATLLWLDVSIARAPSTLKRSEERSRSRPKARRRTVEWDLRTELYCSADGDDARCPRRPSSAV
jgi:threonine/homoserine/homoserine lactone efflux protein